MTKGLENPGFGSREKIKFLKKHIKKLEKRVIRIKEVLMAEEI